MSDNWIPVGQVFLSDEAYGESMTELQEALEDAGFRLDHDPVRNQADLEMEATDE